MVQTRQDMQDSYAQAMALLSGRSGDPGKAQMAEAYNLMTRAATLLPPAKAMLSVMTAMGCGTDADDNAAIRLFLEAAASGFPPSVRALACILLGDSLTHNMGAGLLKRAALGQDWIAAFLILRLAEQGLYLAEKPELVALANAMSPAVPFAEELQSKIEGLQIDLKIMATAPFSRNACEQAIRRAMTIDRTPEATTLHIRSPRITAFESVLTPLECDYLISTTTALMQPSKVVDADQAGAISAGYRTSDGAVLLPAHKDLVHVIILKRLAEVAGVRPEQGEFLSLLRYRPGQEYRPHHDFLEKDAQDYSKVKSSGQRQLTLLTYLNAGYDGGDTAFPDIDIDYKGGVGDALLFENADAKSHPIKNSLHAGRPVTCGEKWLATLWCREKPFWPWHVG